MSTLFVAAGGGGDAVGALLVRRLFAPSEQPLIATCAWERLRIDPVPGPRPLSGFTRLGDVNGASVEIFTDTDTRPPGLSTLPQLVRETSARVFLIDLEGGAVRVAAQLRHLLTALGAGRMVVVDVGGDIVASGDESGLLSPLADSLMLAGASRAGAPVTLAVAGAGLDGELAPSDVHRRLQTLGAQRAGVIETADAQALSSVLTWHPTEGSALLAAAALGVRGAVDMRRGGAPITLDDNSADVWTIQQPDLPALPLAQRCLDTRSLAEAEHALSDYGNELQYERSKAQTGTSVPELNTAQLVSKVRRLAASAPAGATHITTRRLLERLDAPNDMTPRVVSTLEAQCHRDGPLWRLADLALLH